MPISWHLGTMGFGYKDWIGPFYPDRMPTRNHLSHYSRYFNAVEIDSTFYGTPRLETVRRWRSVTGPDFRFCLKVPQSITHELRLQGAQARDDMERFLETVQELGDKLGVILFQFPPSYGSEEMEFLSPFLEGLDRKFRYATEFRNGTWYNQQTADRLTELGISWATTEYPDLPRHSHWTATHRYVRWIGQHGRFGSHTHERIDMTTSLAVWKEQLLQGEDHQVFGFFNNDYAGFAPATCQRFMTLLGMPTRPLRPPQQGTLF